MLIGIIHINAKRKRDSKCRICKEDIKVGTVHAVIILRYGNRQKSIQDYRKSQGKKVKSHTGLSYRRLHLSDCLAKWLIATNLARSLARRERKGGRPLGTGALAKLEPVDSERRHKLLRKRAAIRRQIVSSDDPFRLQQLFERLKPIDAELMSIEPLNTKMIRQDPEVLRSIAAKRRQYAVR